jgi:Global regulator protein family
MSGIRVQDLVAAAPPQWNWWCVAAGAYLLFLVVGIIVGLIALSYRHLRDDHPNIPWWLAIPIAVLWGIGPPSSAVDFSSWTPRDRGIRGLQVRIVVSAPKDVPVNRGEIAERNEQPRIDRRE